MITYSPKLFDWHLVRKASSQTIANSYITVFAGKTKLSTPKMSSIIPNCTGKWSAHKYGKYGELKQRVCKLGWMCKRIPQEQHWAVRWFWWSGNSLVQVTWCQLAQKDRVTLWKDSWYCHHLSSNKNQIVESQNSKLFVCHSCAWKTLSVYSPTVSRSPYTSIFYNW